MAARDLPSVSLAVFLFAKDCLLRCPPYCFFGCFRDLNESGNSSSVSPSVMLLFRFLGFESAICEDPNELPEWNVFRGMADGGTRNCIGGGEGDLARFSVCVPRDFMVGGESDAASSERLPPESSSSELIGSPVTSSGRSYCICSTDSSSADSTSACFR